MTTRSFDTATPRPAPDPVRAARGPLYSDLIVEALRRFPEREAFVSGERRMTYAQAADLTARIVRVLGERGLGRGCGVGALSPNAPEVWLVQAATYLHGGHYSGLHPLGSAVDHARLCDEAEIEVLVVHPHHAELGAEVARRSEAVRTVLTIGPCDLGEDLLAHCAERPGAPLRPAAVDPEDTAWLQYTGGTTGRPKGVMLPQRALAQQVQSWLSSQETGPAPRYLAVAPISHAAVLPILPILLRGGTVVLQGAFDPESWVRTVRDERITYAMVVPTMLHTLLEQTVASRADLGVLETINYGAAPTSESLITRALDRFGPIMQQGYGATEACGDISLLRKDEHDPVGRPELLSSVGRPVIGLRLTIRAADGAPVPEGEVGEICLRSRAVMNGYWRQPEPTAEALRDGWLHTGDLGRVDDQGFLHIVDRSKDLIISGGYNIYPREVEDVLDTHPGVSGSAVVGLPDERWGEAVTAFVVPHRDRPPDVAELIALVRGRKGAHHAPKTVEFLAALPTTPVGKVDKKALRRRAPS